MKLIAIDLDGTLLGEDSAISQANEEAILDVQNQGDIVAISSGRALYDIEKILQPTRIECPIMTGNGAVSYYKGQEIQRFSLAKNVVEEIVRVLEKSTVHYELYTEQGKFNRPGGKDLLLERIRLLPERVTGRLAEQLNHYLNHHYDLNETLSVAPNQVPETRHLNVYKLLVLSLDENQLHELSERFAERADISLTSSGRVNIELGHPEASKGNALKFMAEHLGIPLENTVAIGDNYNDLSMFEMAGMSIAMGNAEEELKRMSTHQTKHHNEDGVAYALRTYLIHK